MGLLKWWKGRRWEYLGYNNIVSVVENGNKVHAGVVHFYMWVNNNKRRKFTFSGNLSHLKKSEWYNTEIVPWLEGGDVWKPVSHPVAVRGTLINHLTRTS